MIQPLISVCVPTYNYGRFLDNCIRSVVAQTYRNWELVICDDLSKDDSAQRCADYCARDSRIRYHLNSSRLGVYGNLAHCVALSRGEYVKILCSDDWLHPECLEQCVSLADRNPTAALICTNCVDTDEAYNPLWANYVLPKEFMRGREVLWRETFGYRCVGGNSSFFFPRQSYDAVRGYDTSFAYFGDYVLGLKLCMLGDFAHTNRPLFFGRRHESQSSVQDPKAYVDIAESWQAPEAIRDFALAHGLAGPRVIAAAVGVVKARTLAYYWIVAAYHWFRGRRVHARQLFRHLPRRAAWMLGGAALLPLALAQAAGHKAWLHWRRRRTKLEVIHFD